jgi:hypothetical protein
MKKPRPKPGFDRDLVTTVGGVGQTGIASITPFLYLEAANFQDGYIVTHKFPSRKPADIQRFESSVKTGSCESNTPCDCGEIGNSDHSGSSTLRMGWFGSPRLKPDERLTTECQYNLRSSEGFTPAL